MNPTELSGRKLGTLGVLAVTAGLLGAGVTGCDLTQPNHFKGDSSSRSDSNNSTNSLSAATVDDVPVFLTDGAAG